MCGSESPPCGPCTLNHEDREGAVKAEGLDGPLANGILPLQECNVKFPASFGNTRISHFLELWWAYVCKFLELVLEIGGFLGDASGKEPACQCRKHNEAWVWSLCQEDPLEEGMATYSSIHAWRIPWTEEPGGLPSTGSQRVRHDWSNLACTYTLEVEGLPWWLSGKEPNCQRWRHRFSLWIRRIPWSKKWQPTPGFLPGKSHGQRSLEDYSPCGQKELDMTEWLSTHTYILNVATFLFT